MAPRVLVYLVLLTTIFCGVFSGSSMAGGPPVCAPTQCYQQQFCSPAPCAPQQFYPSTPCGQQLSCPQPNQCGCGLPSPFSLCGGICSACTSICGACMGLPAALMGGLLTPPRGSACAAPPACPPPACRPTCGPPPCLPYTCGPMQYGRCAPRGHAPRRRVPRFRPVSEAPLPEEPPMVPASYTPDDYEAPTIPVVESISPVNPGAYGQYVERFAQEYRPPVLRLVGGSLVPSTSTDLEDGTYATASGPYLKPLK